MEQVIITSKQNPRVKEVVKLRNRRDRDASGKFLVEGYREILRALDAGWVAETIFFSPDHFLGSNEEALIARVAEKLETSGEVFEKMSYRDRPDGVLAIFPQKKPALEDLPVGETAFYVVAEAIEKPGNLGSILRSCDAVGASGLIVCDKCTDIYNPNVVRASVGTLFSVPVVETTTEKALAWLRENGVKTLAATPAAKASYTELDFSGKIAIVVGTEQLGLSEAWMEEADLQVRIPMHGKADSLNVATATTLLLYEVRRWR